MTLLPTARQLALAAGDIRLGARSVHLWPMLGWLEIKQRYRRSVLGPFWLTISYGVLIGSMGPLYGLLLRQDVSGYFPYLAVGFVVWLLIANLITDGCFGFMGAEGFITQSNLPLSVHVLRNGWKNLIIFAHNAVIVVLVVLVSDVPLSASMWLVPLGVLAVVVNGLWAGLLLGMVCARFRDIPQLVASVVQVAFFLTLVMWRPEMLGSHAWIARVNPIFHFIQIIRSPILGEGPALQSWLVVLATTVAGSGVAMLLFGRFRTRIAYWV